MTNTTRAISLLLCLFTAACTTTTRDEHGGFSSPSSRPSDSTSQEPCNSYCRMVAQCEEADPTCAQECTTELLEVAAEAPPCGPAVQDLLGCLGSLDCAEYAAYWAEATPDYPCAAYDDAVDACDNGEETEVGGSSSGGGAGSSGGSYEDECSSDSDCSSQEVCSGGSCQSVECTSDAHCSSCSRCVSNSCSYCGEGPYGCYC